MIIFEKVSKIYPPNFVALQDINLTIEKGEFVSIVGQTGAGKSTLLKLIYAEEEPTSGRVYFNNRPIDKIKRRLLPYFRRNIGTVFQDFKLLSNKTVFENVAYALEVMGDTNEEISEKVPNILEVVGIREKSAMYPVQLSGGEKQKVSLARALVHNPLVLIADEPTGNLDPDSTAEITELLLKINDFGTTVILATHKKDTVNKINRRVVVLNRGKIIHDQKKGKYTL